MQKLGRGQLSNTMATNVKIATDIFRQRWFRKLSTDYKTLWLFLMAESNIVGVFEIDCDSWNFNCGPSVSYKDCDPFTRYGNRIQRIPKHPDKGIIVGKLDYQRSFGKNSSQWQWVEKALGEVGITYERLQEMKSHEEDQLELALEIPPPAKSKKMELRNQIPPTVEMVRDYCLDRRNAVDPQKFYDFYSSKGWKIGKNRMKDWQAAVRTWEGRDEGRGHAIAAPAINQPTRRMF